MKCQRCQKDAKILTPLPDSDEHVCEECYAAAYREAHAAGGRRVGVVAGSILAALAVAAIVYLLIPKGRPGPAAPAPGKEEAKADSPAKAPVAPIRPKATRTPPRTKTPTRPEPPKTGPAVASPEAGSPLAPVGTAGKQEGAEKKDGGEAKTEAPVPKVESQDHPGAENAFVRVTARRASTVGSLPVRYFVPAESEDLPPRTEQATLSPANGTFLRLDIDLEILSGEGIALGPVSLTFGGGTYYPSQWEAFGRGCQGASAEDLVLMRGASLELYISGEQDDVIVEGGGGSISRSTYVRDGGGARAPVSLYFDVAARPEGIGVFNIAGLSFDIDFAALGQ